MDAFPTSGCSSPTGSCRRMPVESDYIVRGVLISDICLRIGMSIIARAASTLRSLTLRSLLSNRAPY